MKAIMLCIVTVVSCIFLSGCSLEGDAGAEREKLDFTIISEDRMPQELLELLEGKKQDAFQLTYTDEDYLYVCIGYGEQETGGYGISVKDFSLGDGAIYVDTLLIGPDSGNKDNKSPSYPYIVIKTEKREEQIIFN